MYSSIMAEEKELSLTSRDWDKYISLSIEVHCPENGTILDEVRLFLTTEQFKQPRKEIRRKPEKVNV